MNPWLWLHLGFMHAWWVHCGITTISVSKLSMTILTPDSNLSLGLFIWHYLPETSTFLGQWQVLHWTIVGGWLILPYDSPVCGTEVIYISSGDCFRGGGDTLKTELGTMLSTAASNTPNFFYNDLPKILFYTTLSPKTKVSMHFWPLNNNVR